MRVLVYMVMVVVVVAGPAASLPTHQQAIDNQGKKLQDLGCRPVMQKVRVADQLHEADDLIDMLMFYPHAVALRRCVEDCAYCGDERGIISGRCVASGREEKTFTVTYYDNSSPPVKHHRNMTVTEHTQCICRS